MKLEYPFDYYWKKYSEGHCPFCDSEEIQDFENLDVAHCSVYGGYLSIYQDEAFAGGDGMCKNCESTEDITSTGDDFIEEAEDTSPYRTIAKGNGFLCEECNHGVDFEKAKVFQVLFHNHDEKTCKHCTWHNSKSPDNKVEKPPN
ncbi:MAG: hypothetical protein ABSB71_04975 [Candidatus Bathyarchaeia archaeon]|jgi:hypothetical protein